MITKQGDDNENQHLTATRRCVKNRLEGDRQSRVIIKVRLRPAIACSGTNPLALSLAQD